MPNNGYIYTLHIWRLLTPSFACLSYMALTALIRVLYEFPLGSAYPLSWLYLLISSTMPIVSFLFFLKLSLTAIPAAKDK